jgi:hypothetical protein
MFILVFVDPDPGAMFGILISGDWERHSKVRNRLQFGTLYDLIFMSNFEYD